MCNEVNRFVILGQARSGTWFFTHMINQHPEIIAAGELFHVSASVRREMYSAVMPGINAHRELYAMDGDLNGYFYEPISNTHRNVRAVGFKMLYEHVDGWWARGDRCLENDSTIRVIHILRRSPLDVLVSWRIACLEQEWWDKETTRRIHIDPMSALDWLQRRDKWIRWGEGLRATHSVLTLDYDMMISQPQSAINATCDFLSLRSVPVSKPNSKRQDNRQHLRDKVENYVQLAEALRNSPWALTDE